MAHNNGSDSPDSPGSGSASSEELAAAVDAAYVERYALAVRREEQVGMIQALVLALVGMAVCAAGITWWNWDVWGWIGLGAFGAAVVGGLVEVVLMWLPQPGRGDRS